MLFILPDSNSSGIKPGALQSGGGTFARFASRRPGTIGQGGTGKFDYEYTERDTSCNHYQDGYTGVFYVGGEFRKETGIESTAASGCNIEISSSGTYDKLGTIDYVRVVLCRDSGPSDCVIVDRSEPKYNPNASASRIQSSSTDSLRASASRVS